MVQSMRSGTIVRPGERAGCVGCHEDRRATPSLTYSGDAWQRGPRALEPWYGPPRLFSYTAEVQPVFDKHCVSCHDYGKDDGQKLNLAGDLGVVFNTSYCELRGKDFVRVVGAGPTDIQPPKSWGSHASRLAKIVLEGHGKPEIDAKVKLDRESVDRVLTWIDINAPYYADYSGGPYRDNPYGRAPLTAQQVKRLHELTGVKLDDRKQIGMANFTRPEFSASLGQFSDKSDPRYREALDILRAGAERLAREPRLDMPGFRQSNPIEIAQEKKYQALREQETRMREAAVRGEKLFQAEAGGK
jgi:hypothetical protein